MRIIFCEDPLDRSKPDFMYADEFSAAVNNGFDIGLINFEALTTERDAARAAKKIILKAEVGELLLYRGWMLSPDLYESLYKEFASAGLQPINSPHAYKHCHYLPEWLPDFDGHTPKTIYIPKIEFASGLCNEKLAGLHTFENKPVIVKDYVKSEKHHWLEACFIPDASKQDEVQKVTNRFLELRGAALEGGLVYREFVQFQALKSHSKSGMPLTKEFRLFVLDGKIFHWFNYWEEGEYGNIAPPLEKFTALAKKPQSRFFTMDIAETISGDWLVVELGDAQVSGLPENTEPERFYRALATTLL